MTTSAAFTTPFLFLCLFSPLKSPHTSHTCRFSGGVDTSSIHTHWFFFFWWLFYLQYSHPSPSLSRPLSSLFYSPFALLFSDDTSRFTGDGGEVGVERQQYSWCLRIFVLVLCFKVIVYYYISIVSCEFTLDNQSPALTGVPGLIILMGVFLFPTKCWVFLQSKSPPLGVTKSHRLHL